MITPDFNLDCLESLSRQDDNLTPEKDTTLERLRQWLQDFDLGEASEPGLPPYVLHLVSIYSAAKMREPSMSL